MKGKNSYYWVVYSATTDCGRPVRGSCDIVRSGGGMFNKKQALDYITSTPKKGFIVSRDTIVIENWIKFGSKQDYNDFYSED